jgi:ankyrin repeat protein
MLQLAAYDKEFGVVAALLAAGADVNATGPVGFPPRITQQSHDRGPFQGGQTALIRAASQGHHYIVSLLIHAGADMTIKDVRSRTYRLSLQIDVVRAG